MGVAPSPSVLWFPTLIGTLIAASIVWMALANVPGATVVISALVPPEAWPWTPTRSEEHLHRPALDAAVLAAAMPWLTLLLVAVGASWGLSSVFRAWQTRVGGLTEEDASVLLARGG